MTTPLTHLNPPPLPHDWLFDTPSDPLLERLRSLWSDLLWFGDTQDGVNTHYHRLAGYTLCLAITNVLSRDEHHRFMRGVDEWVQQNGWTVPRFPRGRDGREDW